MRYLHTMVRVTNIEDSLDFYCNKMGMTEIRRHESEQGRFTLIFLAGGDDIEAAKAACAAVDKGLGRVIEALDKAGGRMIVTADHGNCETMIDPETGGPHTAHTLNPVPVILVGGPGGAQLRNGRLADLAPTLLDLMGLPKPDEMTGESLIT